MSHWNHRVCKAVIGKQTNGEPLVEFTIREVYYNDADDVCGVTEQDPVIGAYATDEYFPPDEPKPTDENMLAEMAETIERFKKALEKPILDLDNITYGDWDK